MKRDINLTRKLLLDIENRGADCSVSVLRTGPDRQREERIRYHLRLLIDAGLLKEIDRTTDGIPCVRLTHQGHELLELIRDESTWHEALWTCHDRTGSLSLTVIQNLLSSWASRRARQPLFRRHRPCSISGYRLEPAPRPYREELGYREELDYPTESFRPLIYRERAAGEYPEVHYVPVPETPNESYPYDQPWRISAREQAERFNLNGEHRFRTADKDSAEPPYDSTLADHIL